MAIRSMPPPRQNLAASYAYFLSPVFRERSSSALLVFRRMYSVMQRESRGRRASFPKLSFAAFSSEVR